MLTHEQLSDFILKHSRELAELAANLKSAHKRIDENNQMTEGIHKLAANVEALAIQVKMLTESVNASVKKLEEGQNRMDERICVIEREPANRWKALVSQVIALVVAAVTGGIIIMLTR